MHRQVTHLLLFTFVFTSLLIVSTLAASARQSDLTVEDYCRLTQSLMEFSVQEWEERLNVATLHKGDRKELAAKLDDVTSRRRPQRDEIYRRYGFSSAEDLRFARENRAGIESYLEEHPEVRDSISQLKDRINALIEQFEAAVKPLQEGA